MGSMNAYLENKILDHILGNTAFSAPATVYVGLWTATLSASSTGSTAGEVSTSGTGYGRVAVTNNSTNFPAATSATKKNGTAVNFGTTTASWGTVTYVGICDATTGGNMLYWGALTTPKTIDSGDTVTLPINSIVITQT